jgi:alpha-tubulin suppressor-like RCC1 family protein
MHYSTTGITPTESDPVVTAGAAIPVTQSLTLSVRSFKAGAPPSEVSAATYVLKAVAPSLSPAGGVYASTQSVMLSTTTSSSTIRYTVDGRTPTIYSTAYTTPLTVAAPTTIRALATRAGWTPSDVVTATYWVAPPATLIAPTISPAAGTYATERVVTITPAESGASVRYTIDGTDPTSQSPLYVRAFAITQTVTIKARTYKAGYAPGPVASSTFTISLPGLSAAPSMSPTGGRFTTQRVVTLTGPAGATLRYTTNGVDPADTDATIASGNTVIVDRSMVLKVRAWQAGLAPSVVRREDYVITGAIAAGEAYSVALKADGSVWTWGNNTFGQLGDGGTAGRTSPSQVLTGATAIAAGYHHAVALKTDGTVWAWGENYAGEVGDGTTTIRRSPVPVSGLSNVVAVAASFCNSYAVKADGTVWAWGLNWGGQIGDGTTTNRWVPVQVPGLAGVQAIAAGEGFALALVTHGASTGAVWAWGYNSAGQLGDGTTTTRLTPQPVVGASLAKAVFAGRAWAMARTAEDELLLWGVNDNGQMANGVRNSANNAYPVRTGPWIGPVSQLGGGFYHVLAVARDGRLWGWGDNWEFELAYTPSDFRLSVEPIPALSQVLLATGGGFHTLAVATDGQVWVWGKNDAGQLGTGNTGWLAVPTPIAGFSVANNSWLAGDQDSDGLATWREYQLGTDPLSADTDGDGIPDATDTQSGQTATNLDPDGDGLSNALEVALRTDPYSADTDGDTVPDGADAFPLDPSRWQAPAADPNDHTPPVITLIYPTNARPVGGGL